MEPRKRGKTELISYSYALSTTFMLSQNPPQRKFELKKPCNVKSGLVGKSKPTKLTSLVNLLFFHRFDVVER